MARQYKRVYSLTFKGEDSELIINSLRVAFEITKSMRSYPNLAKIDIYNPNPDTIAFIEDKDPLVILKAGYEGNISTIFRGRIRNLFVNKQSVDRVITIFAGDGERDWQGATFNKTFSSNIALRQVVEELFATFNISGDVTIGSLEDLKEVADKLLGQTLSGSTKDILDKLAEDYGFQWSIQDGELVTVKEDKPLEALTAVLVKQTTGMIGSPTVTEIGADVTMLMNPELLPNRAFKIESESQDIGLANIQFRKIKRTVAEGLYRAYEVIFVGDTHGNQWFTTAKGTIARV